MLDLRDDADAVSALLTRVEQSICQTACSYLQPFVRPQREIGGGKRALAAICLPLASGQKAIDRGVCYGRRKSSGRRVVFSIRSCVANICGTGAQATEPGEHRGSPVVLRLHLTCADRANSVCCERFSRQSRNSYGHTSSVTANPEQQ